MFPNTFPIAPAGTIADIIKPTPFNKSVPSAAEKTFSCCSLV